MAEVKHYTYSNIECREYMQDVMTLEEFRGYIRGSMIKYLHRVGHKDDPVREMEKVKDYAQWYIDTYS